MEPPPVSQYGGHLECKHSHNSSSSRGNDIVASHILLNVSDSRLCARSFQRQSLGVWQCHLHPLLVHSLDKL